MKIGGLSNLEVTENRKRYGSNELTQWQEASFWEIFKKYSGDFFIETSRLWKISVLAEVLYIVTILQKSKPINVVYIPIYMLGFIYMIQLVQSFISFIVLRWDKDLYIKTRNNCNETGLVKVIRNKKVTDINIKDLVCEDLVLLKSGDIVSADGILIEGYIKVNQSRLSGDNCQVSKEAIEEKLYSDEENNWSSRYKCFRGSIVTEGNGVLKVTAVGANTALDYVNLGQAYPTSERNWYLSYLQEKYIFWLKKILTVCYFVICFGIILF